MNRQKGVFSGVIWYQIHHDSIKQKFNHKICFTSLIYEINWEVLEKRKVYEFDLTQHKDNCDDWIVAFEKSIEKRTKNIREQIFIGLSGGYDSSVVTALLQSERKEKAKRKES